ncbi:MAG: hypothetical protein ISS34_03495 [Candidatus Omnitrophica bacterium]|nr:hypothetical protein [Candidatus Omnitrophota bacterium]
MITTKVIKRPASKILALFVALFALSQTGCGPTYPKEILDKAIIQLCREEYNVEVKVKIIGSTIGVYIPLEGLFDATLNISRKAADKINDVMLSTSRVALSSDAPMNFYIVVAQDPLLPEIEVVLVRYIRDIKMLHYTQISRGEFSKRMMIDIKLTPQAQKEKVLRDIFGRLNIEEADDLIEEYLKTSEVTSIGDIGYWNDTFYMKDIYMGEFLALQTADRIKRKLATTPSLREDFKLNLIKGEFLEEGGKFFFRFSFNVSPLDQEALFINNEALDNVYDAILEEAALVLHGYKFNDFWNIEIVDVVSNQVLFATSDELEAHRKKKMKLEEFRRWYR